MALVRTFLTISKILLIASVVYGVIYVDARCTLLLLPPLLAFYATDERYLPEKVAEAMRNPKPLSKLSLLIAGLYFGLKLSGFDFDVKALFSRNQAGDAEL
jgi:hypothetical protein